MLTIAELYNTIPILEWKDYLPNTIFHAGERISYEGEEAQIIRLSPFPVVKTSSRVICGDLLGKIKRVETGRKGCL